MSGVRIRSLVSFALVLALGSHPGIARSQGPASDEKPEERRAEPPPPLPESSPATPVRLFAAVEGAWVAGDAEAFSALVDTTAVRIALKPGATPTTAPTRSAAAFLFQDQLRLVTSQTFQIRKVAVSKGSASAEGLWTGDWGGRTGVRAVKVTFTASAIGGRWLLREVRARG